LRSGWRKICQGGKISAKIHDGPLGGMSNNSSFRHFKVMSTKTCLVQNLAQSLSDDLTSTPIIGHWHHLHRNWKLYVFGCYRAQSIYRKPQFIVAHNCTKDTFRQNLYFLAQVSVFNVTKM
jgi:hypothetical protein